MKSNDFTQAERFCYGLIVALVTMYALVPYLTHLIGWRLIDWAYDNFIYSLALLLILLCFKSVPQIGIRHLNLIPKSEMRYLSIFIVFVVAIFLFYQFPWHTDRTSLGSKFSALARAIWLYVVFSLHSANEKKRTVVFVLTLILMLVDESRTTFILCIFFLTIRSEYSLYFLPIGVLSAIILAAVRMSASKGVLFAIWYGLFGEAYNGAFPISQTSQINFEVAQAIAYSAQIILQPIVFVLIKFVSLLSADINAITAHSMLVQEVKLTLNQKLAPMGGWYIPASFVHLGYFGPIAMGAYLLAIFSFSKILFYSKYFPYHLLFIFLAIKATPHVYVNFCIYYALVFFVMNQLRKIKV